MTYDAGFNGKDALRKRKGRENPARRTNLSGVNHSRGPEDYQRGELTKVGVTRSSTSGES